MKILESLDLINYKENSAITIGFFDGVHLGHKKILETLVNESKKNHLKSVVITFDDSFLSLFKNAKNILSFNEKVKIFNEFNIDYLLVLNIKDGFINLNAKEFIDKYLKQLNVIKVICGSDFSFAYQKEGNVKYLKENTNYEVIEVSDEYINDIKISSTLIRKLLAEGNIELANSLLYEPFFIESFIIHGYKIGRTINFKTANLKINNSCFLLKQGVYFGKAIILNNSYNCLINVGNNPTVNKDDDLHIEVYILDFNIDIYDNNIKVIFNHFEREEIKFNNINELANKIKEDLANFNRYLKEL